MRRGSAPPPATYRLFGARLRTAFPFSTPLPRSDGPPHLEFLCTSETSDETLPPAAFSSAYRTEAGERALSVHRLAGGVLMRFAGLADFELAPRRILCRCPDPAGRRLLVELRLLGPVMAVWLELEHCPALHASAVVLGGRGAAFLSGNARGKSTLLAAFLAAGHPMLADDIVAVERGERVWRARPGYPQLRLSPAAARRFAGPHVELAPVYPGFEKRRLPATATPGGHWPRAAPLGGLYLLERGTGGEGPSCLPLPPGQALIELVRHSFAARVVEALGLQPARLARLARLVGEVPFSRLLVPDGLDRLPEVCGTVEADLSRPRRGDG